MPQAIVWIFLSLASVFAVVHQFAISATLYWYYSWFDILMHFWGGILIVLGVFALCSLKHIPLKPSLVIIIVTLVGTMVVWEIFEYAVGLYDSSTHLMDTSKDILVGSLGGVVGYFIALWMKLR